MKSEKGFTLIEMMIVLFVITILLLITIPNVTKHQSTISKKGCEGLMNMVQAQVQAYWLDHNKMPDSISDLQNAGYLKQEEAVCPGGEKLILVDGEVRKEY